MQDDRRFEARTWALTTLHSTEVWMAQLGRADEETEAYGVAGLWPASDHQGQDQSQI